MVTASITLSPNHSLVYRFHPDAAIQRVLSLMDNPLDNIKISIPLV